MRNSFSRISRWFVLFLLLGLVPPSGNFSQGNQGQSTPHEIDFPYYSVRDGFDSVLTLTSNFLTPQSFSVSIFSRSGKKIVGPTLPIQPQEKISIGIADLLRSLSADPTGDLADGSVAVNFTGDNVKSLMGQILISNPATGMNFISRMFKNNRGQTGLPATLNLLWWGLADGRDAGINVSNIADNPVAADVSLDFNGHRHLSSVVYFNPRETKVISVVDLLNHIGEQPRNVSEGGITINPRGAGASLIVMGQMSNSSTGLSTSLHLPRLDRQAVGALHATGIPIGTPAMGSSFSGMGTFVPHVIVRNLTGTAQNVTLTVEYPGVDGPRQTVLPTVTLDPLTTKDISLDSYFGLLPLPLPFCSIRIQYDGAPDSVMSEVVSVEQNGQTTLSASLANEGDGYSMHGASPWHLDATSESILYLTNMGERDARIGFKVEAHDVSFYLTDLKLKPHETRIIDLRQLRDSQQEDFRKNKIPLSATEGLVKWVRLDNVPVIGQFIGLNRAQRSIEDVSQKRNGGGSALPTAPNFLITPEIYGDCPCPPDYNEIYVPSPICWTMLPGDTCAWTSNGEWVDCEGGDYYFDVTFDSIWSSTNTSVATVDYTALVTAVLPGSSTINAHYADFFYYSGPRCATRLDDYSGGKPVSVLKLSCGSVTRGQQATCSINPSVPSGARVSDWTFKDSTNNIVTAATNTTGTWSGIAVVSGTVSVNLTLSSGRVLPLSTQLNVTPRTNFAFKVVASTQVKSNSLTCYEGTEYTLPSPPVSDSIEGGSCADLAYSFNPSASIPNGPNNGYLYVTSVSDATGNRPTKFEYIVVSDLLSATPFFTAQCGTYSSSNGSGFIAGSQLKQNAFNHEQGAILSHYSQYRDAQNKSDNNIGTVLEAVIGTPGMTSSTFGDKVRGAGDAAMNRISQAAHEELCDGRVIYDSSQSCKYCGPINYAPYQSCGNSRPVPYCH